MNLSRLTMAGALLLAISHCWAAEESLLDLRFDIVEENKDVKTPTVAGGAAAEPQKVRNATNCSVVIRTPNDVRRNKDTLGTTFSDNPIISKPAVTDWLQEALLNMNKEGLNTSLASEAESAPSTGVTYVSTDLEKVYVWFHGMNIQSTLVANARLKTGAGPEVQHHYRIVSTKANWASTDSEYVTTLNMAASRLIKQIASDIERQCQAKVDLQVKN